VFSTLKSYISMTDGVVGNKIENTKIISHRFFAIQTSLFKNFNL